MLKLLTKGAKIVTCNNINIVKNKNQFYKSTVKNLANMVSSRIDKNKNKLIHEDLYGKSADDEVLAKRLLLEFNNNNKIFLPKRLSFLIENLYRPNHLNIDFLNLEIIKLWPSNIGWVDSVANLDLCIIEANNVNKNAEIQLDLNKIDDILSRDVASNIRNYSRLIAIIIFNNDNDKILYDFDGFDERKFILKRRADLIISNKGVFAFCEKTQRLKMLEYTENFSHCKPLFDSSSFQPFIDRNSIKKMPQECI